MITIQPVASNDMRVLVGLLEEMDRFYGAPEFDPIEERISQVRELLLRDRPAAFVLLAREDTNARGLGFAAYSYLWPAVGISQSLYLKELYVAETSRRQGVGRLLMTSVFEIARTTGCSRVEWATDRDNTAAMRFYQELGHEVNAGKVAYRATLG